MCRKVTCPTCSKATWSGCGLHIDSALSGVDLTDRCLGWKTGVCQLAEGNTKTDDDDDDDKVPDNITPAYLESRVRASIQNISHLSIEDTSDGCGSKFIALIVSDTFEGVKRLQRHRMINGAEGVLSKEMETIHALTLKLHTVKEYEKKMMKNNDAAANK